MKRGTGEILPMVHFLSKKEMGDRGADIVRTKVTSPVIREDARQKVYHERPSRVRRIGDLKVISHQEEVGEAELVKIQGGASIGAVAIGEAAGSPKMSSRGCGIQG
jgi:hypothetical protein